MSFKGQFDWISSMRRGGRKSISFTLKCTNMFRSETFDAAIIDGGGRLQPMRFSQLRLKAGQSLRFDFDTVGWDWCQGDTFATLDGRGRMDSKWTLRLPTPAPGECRECHGTHHCAACQGKGFTTDLQHNVRQCASCGGTGVCQTCYMPVRGGDATAAMTGQPTGARSQYAEEVRQRKADALRQRIMQLQRKVEQAEWDKRCMQLRGIDTTARGVYMSQATLKYDLERQILDLQNELRQLEDI